MAKRLLDKGFHAPTVYFPLTVEEGMLIEPTETETKETLDAFADAMLAIAVVVIPSSSRVIRGAVLAVSEIRAVTSRPHGDDLSVIGHAQHQ